MRKNKLKLAGLFLAIACASVCGAGAVAVGNMPVSSVPSISANAEDALGTDITNVTGLTLAKAQSCEYEIVDSATEEGILAGATGSVIKVNSTGSWSFVTLNFAALNINAMDVKSITVRCYATPFDSGVDEFRTMVNGANQIQYGTGAYDLSTWCDVTLNAKTMATMVDANGKLTNVELGIRDKTTKSVLYIDSITVEMASYTTYEINSLTSTKDSSAKAIHSYVTPSEGFPEGGWGDEFVLTFAPNSGAGVCLNDTQLAMKNMKYSHMGSFYIGFGNDADGNAVEAVAGDVLTVDGTFYIQGLGYKFVVNGVKLQYNGEKWAAVASEAPDTPVVPDVPVQPDISGLTEYKPTAISGFCAKTTEGVAVLNGIYIYASDTAEEFPKSLGDWDNKYTFLEGSGDGITLGGNAISMDDIKFPGDFYVAFGRDVTEGEIFTIDGTFYNEAKGIKFTFTNFQLKWNGTAWVAVASEEPGEPDTPVVPDVPAQPDISGLTEYKPTAIGAYCGKAGDVVYLNGVYLYASDTAEEFPKSLGDWDNKYTFYAGSGDGITLGGNAISMDDIKFPGDFYVAFGRDVTEGEIFTIDGTFYNEAKGIKFTFTNFQLQWNGTAWVAVASEEPGEPDTPVVPDVPAQPDISGLTEYKPTAVGAYCGKNGEVVYLNGIYLYAVDTAEEFPKSEGDWDSKYTFYVGSGDGITLGGNAISMDDIKFPGDFYVAFGRDVTEGEIFTIDGTFYNEAKGIKFTFTNFQFKYSGGKWTVIANEQPGEPDTPDAPTDAKVYDLGALAVHKNSTGASSNTPSTKGIYLKIADGTAIPYADPDWKTDFVYESGTGVLLNGENVTSSVGNLKSTTAGLYISFTPGDHGIVGLDVQVGDTITVGGTFYCEKENAKYVFTDSKFVWNGKSWEDYVEYETHVYEGELIFQQIGNAGQYAYFLTAEGTAFPKPEDGNNGWTAEFSWKNGVGIAINGEDVGAVVKFPGQFFIAFKTVPNVGDELTIEGTFYNQGAKMQYVIEESKFVWDGEKWVAILDYVDYEVGAMAVAGGQTMSRSNIYLVRADGEEFAIDSWDDAFTFLGGSGAGIQLNGEATGATQIKTPQNAMYVDLMTSAKDGDVITIGGTFYNTTLLVRYIIEESSFIFENGEWKVYVSPYTEIGVGEVDVEPDSSSAKRLYLVPQDASVVLPDSADDENDYYFVAKNGIGLTMNGEALATAKIQSIDNTIYVSLGVTAEEGDTIVIGGKFVCEELSLLYYVKDCAFVWNGEQWVKDIVYDTYDLGVVKIHQNSNGTAENVPKAEQLYLKADMGNFPIQNWDDAFMLVKGDGLKVNGVSKTIAQMYSTNAGLFLNLAGAGVQPGDIVSLEGEFVCEAKGVKYVIAYSEFEWTGSVWGSVCEKINIGALKFDPAASASWDKTTQFGFTPVDPKNEFKYYHWERYFVRSYGVGVTLNGEEISSYQGIKAVGILTWFVALPLDGYELQVGDRLVISGTFRCHEMNVEYIIAESVFIYAGSGAWNNEIDDVKVTKAAELTAHFEENYAEANYTAAEWAYMTQTLEAAKAAISAATISAEVTAAYDEAIAVFASVPTKDVAEANLATWIAEAKLELMTYKDITLYRDAEKATLQSIINSAKATIDACTSWTALEAAMKDAKASMDALWTAEEWDAAELAVVTAKQDLMQYKAEANYRAAEWTKIQSIINDAKAKIDAAIGDYAAIDAIVENAKASMDAVKTDAQMAADEAAVAAAKADIAAYKAESDYRAQEWATIQAIITAANGKIEAAVGDQAAIDEIVAKAKADMDKVLKTEAAIQKDFNDAKQAALNEFERINSSIDYSKYTDESAAQIMTFLGEAQDAINAATDSAQFASIIDTLEANINGVQQIKTGCGSVVGLAAGITLAAAAALTLRKKKED